MAKRVVPVHVLAVLGVTEQGQESLLQLRLAVSEAEVMWGAVVDGKGGLQSALKQWQAYPAVHDV